MELKAVVCFIACISAASAQCTWPAMLQNSVYRSSSIGTMTFQTNTYQYADSTGFQVNTTCDGSSGDYYFGRYVTSAAGGTAVETFLCLKYQWLAVGAYRFSDYSSDMVTNVTQFAPGTMTATMNSACNTSSSYVVKPEQQYTAVKQGATVSGNSCPSGISGMFNYTLDPMGSMNCGNANDMFTVCGTEMVFDTTNCAAAQSTFTTTVSNREAKFPCLVEDAGVGGVMYITVVDGRQAVPGCVAYKKTGNNLMTTYREGSCNNNQTETWVDMNGLALSMTMTEACSGAEVVLPGLVTLVATLLCSFF